ncbi:MAG TPA: glycoside hydrolase family 127 protein [Anaerolineae bacterium]|nr:glycoside hydrolase family 127 protein [Anaerolineae bacterium]HQH37465.1 glycoside hydrolase family 127 protein [Anaerolineae bacterium]
MHVTTRSSPYARQRSLPVGSVAVTDGFWLNKQTVNRQVSLPHGYRQLERAGNFNNLRLAGGTGEGEYSGPVFMDSDVYKWLEAAAYDLANVRDPEVEHMADEVIGLIVAAQQPDGYLNSYYQVNKPDQRWTNLDHDHELYCAGHLFEAAVAMHRATADRRLLDVACRFADHIATVFGPDKRPGAPGHPEIELALVELYRETGTRRYLDLASFFVDQRGKNKMGGYGQFGPAYHQDRVPVREASMVEGHAVRQLYLTAGVTDVYMETGDPTLIAALERLWYDMTTRKMHVTGGFGAQPHGEAFGPAYDLPTDHCYCETCAAIAAMMWNWRMLLATGEARFADVLERSLYNGFLSGVSLDGSRYFYVNPLQSRGGIERPEWYGCACCPPNVMRQIAVVAHYAATVNGEGLQIYQYMPVTITTGEAQGGPRATLRVETDYPWDGKVRVTIVETTDAAWTLALRVPEWCKGAMLGVNGEPVEPFVIENHMATVRQIWKAGDVIELELAMPPMLVEAHPRVDAVRDCVVIQRGPLIYCLEEVDQPDVDLLDVCLDPGKPLQAVRRPDLLGGVVAVEIPGKVAGPGPWKDHLYLPVSNRTVPYRDATLTAVPYYAWANRGAGAMRVWIPRAAEK